MADEFGFEPIEDDGFGFEPITPKESFLSKLGRYSEAAFKPQIQMAKDLMTPLPGTQSLTRTILKPVSRGIESLQGAIASSPTAEVLASPFKTALSVGKGAADMLSESGITPLDVLLPFVGKLKLALSAPDKVIRAAEVAKIQAQAGPKVFQEAVDYALPKGNVRLAEIDKVTEAARLRKALEELRPTLGNEIVVERKAPQLLPQKPPISRRPLPSPQEWAGAEKGQVMGLKFPTYPKPIVQPKPTPKPFSFQSGLTEQEISALEAFRARLPQGPTSAQTGAKQGLQAVSPVVQPVSPVMPSIPSAMPKTGGVYTGKPNLSLLGDKTSIELAEGLTDEFGAILEKGKGGVIGDKELTQLAARLNLTPEDVSKFKASPTASAKVLAANAVKKDMLNQLRAEVVKTDIDNPEALSAISRTIAKTVNTMKGADALASEAGRSLRARKISTTLLEKAEQASLDAIEAEQLASQPEKLKEIITRLKTYGGMSESELVDEVRKTNPLGKKLFEYVQANSLWSPITHFWNTISGPIGTMAQLATRTLASGAAIPERLAGVKGTQKLGEAPAMLAGQLNGLYDGLKSGIDIILKGTEVPMAAGERIQGAIPGVAGKVIRFPFRLLQATDAVFEKSAGRGEAWSLAYRKASERGGSLKEILDYAKKIVDTDPEILKKAELASKEWTYKMPFGAEAKRLAESGGIKKGVIPNIAYKSVKGMGEFGVDVSRIRQKYPIGSAFLLRFLNTPVNIFKLGVQLGPTAPLSPRNIASLMASPEMRADAIGRVALGGTLTYAIANAVQAGRITGSMPKDSKTRKYWQEQGIRPNSMVVGDEYLPLDRLAIIGPIVTTVADAIQAYKNKDEATASDLVEAAVFSAANNITSQPMLQGARDILNATQYGGLASGGKKALSGAAQSIIPGFSGLGYVARNIDSTVRQPQTIPQMVKSSLPGLSKTVPAKLGGFGQEMKRNYKWGVILSSKNLNDPAVKLLENLDIPIPSYSATYKGMKLSNEDVRNIQLSAGPKIKTMLDIAASNNIPVNDFAKKIVKSRIDDILEQEKLTYLLSKNR